MGRTWRQAFACMKTLLRLLVALAAAWALCARAAAGVDRGPTAGEERKAAPLPAWFKFQTDVVIGGWVATGDAKAMLGHAWELWAAVTSLTEQRIGGARVPVFETWWSIGEIATEGPGAQRRFVAPRQLARVGERRGVGKAARRAAALAGDVKFNDELRAHAAAKGYFDAAKLEALNAGWPGEAAVGARKIEDFPAASVVVKPVFAVVSGMMPTTLNYWAGPANSTTPATPEPASWTKQMVVLPLVDDERKTGAARSARDPAVASVEDFYHIRLTAAEAAEFAAATGRKDIAEGDYALLVALHIASKETGNWTWQTFWWSLDKPAVPARVRERVKPPFDHYVGAAGYSFTADDSISGALNVTCFNPYLEAAFGADSFARPGQLGIESNCMSCHRLAAWPGAAQPFLANGRVAADDPQFFGRATKTDFLWSLANLAKK